MKLLIKKGADINLLDNEGCTPINFGCKYGSNVETIRALIELGVNLNLPNNTLVRKRCNILIHYVFFLYHNLFI